MSISTKKNNDLVKDILSKEITFKEKNELLQKFLETQSDRAYDYADLTLQIITVPEESNDRFAIFIDKEELIIPNKNCNLYENLKIYINRDDTFKDLFEQFKGTRLENRKLIEREIQTLTDNREYHNKAIAFLNMNKELFLQIKNKDQFEIFTHGSGMDIFKLRKENGEWVQTELSARMSSKGEVRGETLICMLEDFILKYKGKIFLDANKIEYENDNLYRLLDESKIYTEEEFLKDAVAQAYVNTTKNFNYNIEFNEYFENFSDEEFNKEFIKVLDYFIRHEDLLPGVKGKLAS